MAHEPARICVVGDLVLDVIAQLQRELAPGDDVPARTRLHPGGQAANVAAWAAALGARARCVARVGDDDAGRIARAELTRRGVELVGPPARRTGIVVALVGEGADRDRSMASDRGEPAGLTAAELEPAWFAGHDWLHVSGYLLSSADGAAAAHAAVTHARADGARISLDAASAALIAHVGAATFAARAAALAPDVLFATAAEEAALAEGAGAGTDLAALTVVKRAATGCTIRARGGGERHHAAHPAVAVDATGAGDAFAAGFLVGGPPLALETGARCVAGVGAMP